MNVSVVNNVASVAKCEEMYEELMKFYSIETDTL